MKDFDKIVLNQSDYLKNVSELIISTPIDSWKIYFKWALINRTAGLLNSTLEKQNFYFYRTVLSGVKKMEPRWKRGVSVVSGRLGEIIGKVYVEKHFNQDAKIEC